ncbi:MAG: hypothetical protein ACOVP4_14245 [Bacteriovoracaceae bacterium]|jgi:hypothetical protein
MKRILFLLLISSQAFAADINLDNISKSDLENVSNELGANFSHTAVSAPETNGLWGIEVGVVGGKTRSEELEKVIDRNGGDGDDFKNLPHGGLMARAHFPLDLFLEATMIPTVKASDAELKSSTLGFGWNAGGFFGLPLDLAVGINASSSEFSYDQVINNSTTSGLDVNSNITFKNKTQSLWVGVSKEFLGMLTPYAKFGTFKSESDIDVDAAGGGTIFAFSSSQKENVETSGGYFAAGLNFQLALFKIGAEMARANKVSSLTGKLSLDF